MAKVTQFVMAETWYAVYHAQGESPEYVLAPLVGWSTEGEESSPLVVYKGEMGAAADFDAEHYLGIFPESRLPQDLLPCAISKADLGACAAERCAPKEPVKAKGRPAKDRASERSLESGALA